MTPAVARHRAGPASSTRCCSTATTTTSSPACCPSSVRGSPGVRPSWSPSRPGGWTCSGTPWARTPTPSASWSQELGANPARIIGAWAAVLAEATAEAGCFAASGSPRGTAAASRVAECQLHELLLNSAFDDGPAWRLLCPYDEVRLPAAVCARAEAHPVRSTSAARGPSDRTSRRTPPRASPRRSPRPARASCGAPSAGPRHPGHPAHGRLLRPLLRAVDEQCEALELAASELATNSVHYGGGSGTVAMWRTTAPPSSSSATRAAGRTPHRPAARRARQEGGRGLFLVNQLCDLVQVRSSPGGRRSASSPGGDGDRDGRGRGGAVHARSR